jgi:hypothetical protein
VNKMDVMVLGGILLGAACGLFFVLTAKAIGYNEGYSAAIEEHLLQKNADAQKDSHE